MTKGADAFRSIGEVARLLGVAPHVLRYWETQFSLLKPMKRPDGRRYYRPDDVRLAAGLCTILRDDGLTIRGAKRLMARDRGASVRERGAARLGDDMHPAPDVAAQGDMLRDTTPGLFDDWLDPPGDEADPVPPQEPRSRLRRRPAPAQAQSGQSPPQHAQTRSDALGWLAAVVSLNARLRDLPPGDRAALRDRDRPSPLRDALTPLRDALARMC